MPECASIARDLTSLSGLGPFDCLLLGFFFQGKGEKTKKRKSCLVLDFHLYDQNQLVGLHCGESSTAVATDFVEHMQWLRLHLVV